jgi:hypothetical protein
MYAAARARRAEREVERITRKLVREEARKARKLAREAERKAACAQREAARKDRTTQREAARKARTFDSKPKKYAAREVRFPRVRVKPQSIEQVAANVRIEERTFLKIQNLAGVNRSEAMDIYRRVGCDTDRALEEAGTLHGVVT